MSVTTNGLIKFRGCEYIYVLSTKLEFKSCSTLKAIANVFIYTQSYVRNSQISMTLLLVSYRAMHYL